MNTLDTIYSRRAIRSYTGEPITEEELKIILKAACASPVGMGRYDNLHLTVVGNAELLKEIDAAAAVFFGNPDMHPLYGAPMQIIVSSASADNVGFSNAAIVVHNMALAAAELGIGACYIWGAVMAVNQKPELVQKLGLPEGFTPCCSIILGKTDEKYTVREIPADRIQTKFID